jgi:hypothetical protein
MGLLTLRERYDLQEWLLQIIDIDDSRLRRQLLSGLPNSLRVKIPFSDSADIHIRSIVSIVESDGARLADGTWPIAIVLANAIELTKGLQLAAQFELLRRAIQQRIIQLPLHEERNQSPDLTDMRALHKQIEHDQQYLQHMKEILSIRPDPKTARLSSIVRVTNLNESVLPMLRHIDVRADIVKVLDINEATTWLTSARALAEAASREILECYRLVNLLIGMEGDNPDRQDHLEAASQAADHAIQYCKQLLSRIDLLLNKPAAPVIALSTSIDQQRRIRTLLLRCDEYMRSHSALRALFADPRLIHWQSSLPEADTVAGRVDQLIAYLQNKRNHIGESGLVLLLQTLVDRYDSTDERQGVLRKMIHEIASTET